MNFLFICKYVNHLMKYIFIKETNFKRKNLILYKKFLILLEKNLNFLIL